MAQYTLGSAYNDSSGIGSFPANNYDLSGEWSRADSDQRHRLNLTGTAVAKNWFTLGVVLLVTSGKPYTITTGTDTYNDGMDNARPPGVSRNSMQGRGYASFDLRLSHDFHLKPTDKQGPVLTTVIDAFNILNHTNYHTYVGVLVSPLFGKPVTAYPARTLQITVRLKF